MRAKVVKSHISIKRKQIQVTNLNLLKDINHKGKQQKHIKLITSYLIFMFIQVL